MISFVILVLIVTSVILYKLYAFYDIKEEKNKNIYEANEKFDELKIVEETEEINLKSENRKVKINNLKTKTQEKENGINE